MIITVYKNKTILLFDKFDIVQKFFEKTPLIYFFTIPLQPSKEKIILSINIIQIDYRWLKMVMECK